MNKITALLTALLLTVSAARADFYSDNNPADVWINALNPSYTGEFTLAGYDPVAQTITSAYAEFTFWDLVAGESIKIDLSGDLLTHGSFSGWLPLSVGIVNAWVTLDTTGALSYTVSRNDNSVLSEFWLKNAYLEVETTARSVPSNNVPDTGATAALLGLGLMGMFAAAKRTRAKRS